MRAVGFEEGAKFSAVHRHRAPSLSAGSDLRAGGVHGPLDFVDGRANAALWPSAISARIEVSAHDLDGAPRLGRADDLRAAGWSPTRSEHTNRNVCSGAETPVLLEAILVGVLSAQLRHPRPRSATSA